MSITNKAEIKATIFKIFGMIAPEIEPGEIDVNEDIREEFEIDSMDFLRVIVELYEAYGIEIPEADYGKIMTLEKMATYILENIDKNQTLN